MFRFALYDLGIGPAHGLGPDRVIIEPKLATHLVLEVGEQLGAALPGSGFENLLALTDQPQQILAFGFVDDVHAGLRVAPIRGAGTGGVRMRPLVIVDRCAGREVTRNAVARRGGVLASGGDVLLRCVGLALMPRFLRRQFTIAPPGCGCLNADKGSAANFHRHRAKASPLQTKVGVHADGMRFAELPDRIGHRRDRRPTYRRQHRALRGLGIGVQRRRDLVRSRRAACLIDEIGRNARFSASDSARAIGAAPVVDAAGMLRLRP